MADHCLPLEEYREIVLRDLRRLIAAQSGRWKPKDVKDYEKKVKSADREKLCRLHQAFLGFIEFLGSIELEGGRG